ncbi:MAG: MFS transporter [Microthrixaceae bacterium]
MTATNAARCENTSQPDVSPAGGSLRRTISLRDFRLLLAGTSTSLLGDQFALIATPWLALQLSNDPLALGIVLALEGIPRAVFMLVGGAVTDRVSPRTVMLAADVTRGILTAAMAAVVLAGATQMWMLYGFALGFGLVAGFAVPAENSIVPMLVGRDDLQAGNAMIMGATQLTSFVGPTLAGAVIASFSASLLGIGLAFAVDTVTFAASAATFALMRPQAASAEPSPPAGLWASIRDGFVHLWEDDAMRFVFCVLAAVNLFVVGPLLVGIPLLAHQRLTSGAMAFGVLMGAFAAGNLAGYILAGGTRPPSSTTMRIVVLGVLAGYGAVIVSLSFVTHAGLDATLLAGLGAGNGYLALTLFTWIQARTPLEMLGRIMSLLTFASLGLVSISQAVAGAVGKWDLDALFVLSGGLVLGTTAVVATRPGLRAFTDSLTESTSSHEKEPHQ